MSTALLLWCSLVTCVQGLAVHNPVRAEVRSFESIRTLQHSKLVGHVLEVSRVRGLLSCSHACLASIRCCSTNFKVVSSTGEGVCELNDRSATGMTDKSLVQTPGFVYMQYGDVTVEESCAVTGCLSCATVRDCSPGMKMNCCNARRPRSSFHFTTLGAKGRTGPTSPAGYSGTSLEGKVHIQQGLQRWTIPVTGLYDVEACGASGGDYGTQGGKGAKVETTIRLQKGTQLTLLIGQVGKSGGGGGGTFVVITSHSSPLVVAGGGGGGGGVIGNYPDGDSGQAGTHGSMFGGTDGTGGLWCQQDPSSVPRYSSGSGGGHRTSGGCYQRSLPCSNTTCDKSGISFTQGGLGGLGNSAQMVGGFGGGGGNYFCAGGGGGYSGGGVFYDYSRNAVHAGGGGSFTPCARRSVTAGGCEKGDGYVTVTTDRLPGVS